MDRIDNVDLREALYEIAQNNTFFHLDNDLNISIEQMERAAKLNDYTDKTLMWVSYPSGIDCYPEREVFQKDTRGYNGVIFHGVDMPNERKLAYAVDVNGIKDGRVYGSLYETDIREYAKIVKENAVPANTIRIYEDDPHGGGKQVVMPKDEFDRRYPLDLVKMAYWRHEPDDPTALKAVMDNVWDKDRDGKYQSRDKWAHTSRLYDERYVFYSDQIIRDLGKKNEPNSADRQFFTVPLNSYVTAAFNAEQLSRLIDALPYKDVAFTIKKGQHDLYVVVPRDEILKERQPQQKPSVTGALKEAAKQATAQADTAKAATKKKTNNMEVD